MLRLVAWLLLAPIAPQSATVHFRPSTPTAQGIASLERFEVDQLGTTWIHQSTGGAIQWQNQHTQGSEHPGEIITRVELNNLTTADIIALRANPLIERVDLLPNWLANLFYLFHVSPCQPLFTQ